MHLSSLPLSPVGFGHAVAGDGDLREEFVQSWRDLSWMDAPYFYPSGASSNGADCGGTRDFMSFAPAAGDCTPPADQVAADSLPAPAVAGGGECSRLRRERRVSRVVVGMARRGAYRWVAVVHGWQGPSAFFFRSGVTARGCAPSWAVTLYRVH